MRTTGLSADATEGLPDLTAATSVGLAVSAAGAAATQTLLVALPAPAAAHLVEAAAEAQVSAPCAFYVGCHQMWVPTVMLVCSNFHTSMVFSYAFEPGNAERGEQP